MSEWGPSTFGDPCRECRYAWSLTVHDAVVAVSGSPGVYREALHSATGRESAPDLAWNVTAYVAHVADNLRIWGERLAAASEAEEPVALVPYNSDALASARRYDSLPLSAALWRLREAAESWSRAWNSGGTPRVFLHPERGRITAEDVARTNAHDVAHHLFDLHRCLATSADDG